MFEDYAKVGLTSPKFYSTQSDLGHTLFLSLWINSIKLTHLTLFVSFAVMRNDRYDVGLFFL